MVHQQAPIGLWLTCRRNAWSADCACSSDCLRQHHVSTSSPSLHACSPVLYSLVSPAHIPEVESAASAVAKHHHTHTVGDSVTSQALKPAAGKGRQR